jgi:hypothetical protein
MTIKPYLCGAIGGISREEARSWRSQAKLLWPHALDPMRRELGAPWGIDELVTYDKFDIDVSNFVLLRWNHKWPASVGSCMEVHYASTKDKLIYAWKDEGWELPPWLDHHTNRKFNSLELLHDHANHYFGLPPAQ